MAAKVINVEEKVDSNGVCAKSATSIADEIGRVCSMKWLLSETTNHDLLVSLKYNGAVLDSGNKSIKTAN
jgi:hypothetical protein